MIAPIVMSVFFIYGRFENGLGFGHMPKHLIQFSTGNIISPDRTSEPSMSTFPYAIGIGVAKIRANSAAPRESQISWRFLAATLMLRAHGRTLIQFNTVSSIGI
jgi:hypothetical protein